MRRLPQQVRQCYILNVMRQVYLDNNATTPVDSQVVEAMRPYWSDHFGNASSIHTYGQKARAAVEEARQEVAALVGAQGREIIFTSGGTEADNTALRGVASHERVKGDHIITSTIEHPAVLRTCEQMEREGFRVTYVGVDREGLIRLDELQKAIEGKTILISIMHANNEVGCIQPIQRISALARENGVLFHTDAVQSMGKVAIDVKELGVDLLSLSGHKFHGPKGVGALYVRQGVAMRPLMLGGSHERRRRAGTENVAGIVGLGKACRLASQALAELEGRVSLLRDRLEQGILSQVPDTRVNGSRTRRNPHVTNISFRAVEGEALLIALDFQGVAVSTGAACSSGSLEPSHVLRAMGLRPDRIQGAIRFSLSRMTQSEDIDYVLEVLPPLVARMREMSVR
ncbi:MAG: cysteine desulfurase NifS [Acidobacteriota bacterium]